MKLSKICASVAMVLAASSMAASVQAAEAKRLTGGGSNIMYIITPSHSNPFFKTEAEVAAKTAKELGYTVKMVSHDDSPVKQSELFETAISDKAAAIVCDNAGADATVAAVKRAYDNNIPTFLIDREINEQGIAITQIVANNYQGAKGAAEVFVEAMEEEGEYAELFGIDSDTNAKTRSTAFHEVIDQYPDMKMVAVQTANWDQNLAYSKMETILQSYPNLKGVISGNDNMAVGAAAAIKAAGKNLKIIGVDGSNDARDEILAGNMTATAMQPAALISEMAVKQADQYLKTGTTGQPEKQLIDCIIITKDNAKKLNDFTLAK
ncbi:MAG: D-ribose ABC transporter substrate-binding protein [Succinivibrio dextrinosolvens]|uniref:D-ribose ABC transporter substrate-binding protein n=1 Tax=Succinivibrio sp. TaxID=2053619 RepID=UPI0025FDAA6B|nr:D-ribose ABC transporter substrate-binding protein [Succinivibrio sp.]MDY6416937.1 D-ribose ABC transporter substrate-binding protein [Succinivibrio dextrinosolvens]MBQ9221781.1 D-ribose ABC transporter substrate-binding protein [Succinivibrio sp.]MDY6420617.1 D-ribose ABC transporter substrate-binding protein [Succinivibrio dextrinosolvens]MDY6465629.1 D-ribose ABC transporter substrate-binding protein [Succinivibrio dextrinosolvens]MDY6470370.1 D-ribose ABC transporter substrate-binding p